MIYTICTITNFLASLVGPSSEAKKVNARLKAANQEILLLRSTIEELGQNQAILEAKAVECDYLCRSLGEANERIELLEAKASKSEAVYNELLKLIVKAREVVPIKSSQLKDLEADLALVKSDLEIAF